MANERPAQLNGSPMPLMRLTLPQLIDILALLFAIVGLTVGGIVLLSISFVSAVIVGIHEVSLSIAVILHLCAVLVARGRA